MAGGCGHGGRGGRRLHHVPRAGRTGDRPAASLDRPPREPAPSSPTSATGGDERSPTVGRVDLIPEGNRVAPGRGQLDTAEPIEVVLPSVPIGVVPVTECAGDEWLVELETGEQLLVSPDGSVTAVTIPLGSSDLARFDDPLPDGRVVESDGTVMALVAPTDRYGHGVLPTDDRTALGILERTGDTAEVVALVPLDGRLTTNIGTRPAVDGRLDFAVGTGEASLRIWSAG